MGVNFVLAFVLVTISYINAENYIVLDETEFDEWDIYKENPIILDRRDHVRHRREAPETDLEGSGEGDLPIPLIEEHLNKTSTLDTAAPLQDNPEEQKQEEANEGVGLQISNFGEINSAVKVEEIPKSNETKTESDQPIIVDKAELEVADNKTDQLISVTKSEINEDRIPTTAQPEQTTTNPIVQTEKPKVNASATEQPEIVSKEQPVLPPLVHTISNETTSQAETTAISKQPSSPQSTVVPPALNTDTPSVLETEGKSAFSSSSNETKDAGKEELEKVTPQVLPSDLAEVELLNRTKESESLNVKQAGNAVMLKVPKSDDSSQVEGSESEKVLQGMAENAKISNEPTEQPATGESAKNVSRAGKDTTILVVLFVVVIAIGGAAFTHNYIKKRKQAASANNDLVNGIRRSLQNLSSSNVKNNPDVEQGTELKPLMKENSPITVTKDYTDTKKEVQA